jgi:iron complex transport system ATP-binding protein
VITGAPEDVVLSGAIGQAFEGRQIRFHQEERSFRLLTGGSGVAAVHGAGLRASLAAAVLEREGYEVAPADASRPAVSVHALDEGWRLWTDDGECSGANFASLAEYLRGRRSGS